MLGQLDMGEPILAEAQAMWASPNQTEQMYCPGHPTHKWVVQLLSLYTGRNLADPVVEWIVMIGRKTNSHMRKGQTPQF